MSDIDKELWDAARDGDDEAVRRCLAKIANVNYKSHDFWGDTPLHEAARKGDHKTCQLLLESGAHVNEANNDGDTPLHKAARKGDQKTCQLLLESGAHVNAPNKNGNTLLHLAAYYSNAPTCKMLIIDFKADTTIKNQGGKVALDCWPQQGFFQPKDAEYIEVEKTVKDAKFRLLMETGGRPVDTAKLFLIGDPATGKTSLKSSLTRGKFGYLFGEKLYPKDKRTPTPGIKVKEKDVKGAGRFMIWDSAGQVEFRVTHAMLLGASRGIFIVTSKCSDPEQLKQLNYWLSFIKAGNDQSEVRKQFIVLVGTHMDECEDTEEAKETAKQNLQELRDVFAKYLVIHDEMILVDSRRSQSEDIKLLKEVLDELAKPLRGELIPKICDEITKRKNKWWKDKVPVLYLQEFLKIVKSEIDKLASDELLETALWYLHHMGEIHRAKAKGENQEDMIILEPNWLTTTIFGPIFADPDFRADYKGLEPKEEYTLTDLKRHFRTIDPDLLVRLLEYFELAYRNDDGTFIIPAKLPPGVENISWDDSQNYIDIFGIRIKCRDTTDMFSDDTFACLQVSCMNRYRQEGVKPKLSQVGLKVYDKVEGMFQLNKKELAIHVAVRVKEGSEKEGVAQFKDMKDCVSQQLKERSKGTKVKISYLSPRDLRASKDLIENVHCYSEEDVKKAAVTGKWLVNRDTLVEYDRIEDIKCYDMAEIGMASNSDFTDVIEQLGPDDLRKLYVTLGLSLQEIEKAESDFGDVYQKGRRVLRVWRTKDLRPTRQALLDALTKRNYTDVREKLEIKWNERAAGFDATDVEGVASNSDFLDVIDTLRPDELQNLYQELHLSAVEIETAEKKATVRDVYTRALYVLECWRQKNGKAATRDVILAALDACRYIASKGTLKDMWKISDQEASPTAGATAGACGGV